MSRFCVLEKRATISILSFLAYSCRSLDKRVLLLSILNRILHVLHLVLVDLELDLSLILHLGQHHECLVIFTIVDESANLANLFISLNRLLHLVDTQGVVNLLLSTISHLLQALEVDHCWLHWEGGLLLLLMHLESHQTLHLHQ